MALFNLGRTVATPAALQFCNSNNITPATLLNRHVGGDFGDICQEDAKANAHALQHDLRIFSVYKFGNGKVWIISESDRSSTTILLPDEY